MRAVNTRKTIKTIDEVFEEFLAEQKARLGSKTYRKYEDIVDLFRSCLEGYWPGHDGEEYNRITKAGGTFCGTFGPEELPFGLSEFLGYFMPHKVMAGKETMKAAGTVTKKLMKWLAVNGFVEDAEAVEMAEARAGEAARELPAARDVIDVLEAYLDEHAPERYSRQIEDHFMVARTEPGKLWLEPFTSGDSTIGPIPVPHEVSRVCKAGWEIAGVAVKTSRGWRLMEVWNVSP
jgi:hypothetical protein